MGLQVTATGTAAPCEETEGGWCSCLLGGENRHLIKK